MEETIKQKKFGRFNVTLETVNPYSNRCDVWLWGHSINLMAVECGGSVWENPTQTFLLNQIFESGLRQDIIDWAYSEGY
tara:strand:+ start:801 stop:1037 length:237 start_codon:yes stop_codon:yes gene_type:complete